MRALEFFEDDSVRKMRKTFRDSLRVKWNRNETQQNLIVLKAYY